LTLRTLIYNHIVCVVFLAAAFREGSHAVFPDWLALPAMLIAALGHLPVGLGFPIAIARAVSRSSLPAWKYWAIAGVEVALAYATFLAVLPAVQ
jgi:hypothetical protein